MRLLLYLILIISIYITINNLIKLGSGKKEEKIRRKSGHSELGSEMVHDLYCNTFIPKESAVKEIVRGRVYYFCSQECFKKFRAGNI